MAPVFVTNWPHQVVDIDGGGLYTSLTGTQMTVDTSILSPQSLKCAVSSSNSFVGYAQIIGQSIMVGRVYIYFPSSLPTGLFRFIVGNDNQSQFMNIEYRDDGTPRIQARHSVGAGGTQVWSGTPAVDTLYRIDWRFDSTGTTQTIDWQVNGVAQTQVSQSGCVASTWNSIRLGSGGTTSTGTILFQHLVLSTTSGDYPIGHGGTQTLKPSADGTHNAGTNVIEDNAGTDIGTTTAYDKINSLPPSATTYIRQAVDGTGNYAEVSFEDISDTHSGIIGATGFLAYTSATTSANKGGCIMSKDSFSTSTTIWGAPGATADYSDGSTSNLFYKSAMLANVTDDTTVNALKARIGYSDDANPDPYWIDLWVEVAYTIATGNNYNQSGDGGITPTGALLKQANKTLSGGNTPSGALSKLASKLLSGGNTPSGGLIKQTNKTLSGSLSSIIGTLSTSRIFAQVLEGTLTTSGALLNQANKVLSGALSSIVGTLSKHTTKDFSGSLTPSGTANKQSTRTFAGTLTLAGDILKQVQKSFSGDLSSSGSVSKDIAKAFAGTLTLAGNILKSAQKAFSGTLTSSGSLLKMAGKLLSGTLTSSGSLDFIKTFVKVLEGTLTSSGTLLKTTGKSLSSSLTSAGDLLKQAGKSLSGTLTGSGDLLKTTLKFLSGVLSSAGTVAGELIQGGGDLFFQSLDGALTLSGTVSKQTSKLLSGAVTSAGTLAKSITKTFSGILNPTGIVSKESSKNFSGNLTFSGIIAKLTSKLFSGDLTSSGSLTSTIVFTKILEGALAFSGSIVKVTNKSVSGALASSGSIIKSISKFVSGVLSFIGSLLPKLLGEAAPGTIHLIGRANIIETLLGDRIHSLVMRGKIAQSLGMVGEKVQPLMLRGAKKLTERFIGKR